MNARKSLLLAGIVVLLGILIWYWKESASPWSMAVRIAVIALCLLAVVVTRVSNSRTHTLWLWASVGATLSLGIFGLFGIGLVGLVPSALVMTYAVLMRRELDYDANLTGAAISGMLLVLVAMPV